MNANDINNYLVTIRCMTYNHKPYILQCLDGFVMQKTNFPFVAIVVDDASTDNEPEILWTFINHELDLSSSLKEETVDYVRIVAPHKTNNKCTFVFIFLKYNHHSIKKDKLQYCKKWISSSKYIALCEGDDFWTDPLKLQKEVNVLEQNPDVLLVYTGFDTVDDKNNRINRPYFNYIKKHSKSGDVFSSQIIKNHVMTLTVCAQADIFNHPLYVNSPYHYDYALSLCASLLGNLFYLPDVTGCYRKTPGSLVVSHKKDLSQKLREINRYFCFAFLNNKGKKRCCVKNLTIKKNILIVYLYDINILNTILKTFPTMKFLLPIAKLEEILIRIKKKITKRTF